MPSRTAVWPPAASVLRLIHATRHTLLVPQTRTASVAGPLGRVGVLATSAIVGNSRPPKIRHRVGVGLDLCPLLEQSRTHVPVRGLLGLVLDPTGIALNLADHFGRKQMLELSLRPGVTNPRVV